MNRGSHVFPSRYGEGLFSAISAGFFFILVGAIFVTTPDLFGAVLAFFRDFNIVAVPNTRSVLLPAPVSPEAHSAVYSAVTQFSLVWGLSQIVILVLRFIVPLSLNKKADTVSNVVFWLGASYLVTTLLNETTTHTIWFAFWAEVIMLIGVSLIVKAVILAVRM